MLPKNVSSQLVDDEMRLTRGTKDRVAFFVSGTGVMSDEVRRAVVNSIGGAVPADQVAFFDGSFGWQIVQQSPWNNRKYQVPLLT